ncbi:hypothetical protein CI109_106426 [Kwoniella shandongensis]|uniref:MARVEL domain-containing protein n=1 Tax=Kwoniella shandongensis TaxID=1734106 RepID=A0A5M6C4Z1_9TREE|nr:uncharacterized protein CI109_002609 [Kwoniella shandongensis]KAA5528852.1 hypothetical protein CI109_002609 [Kwoniella shandongensis]
MSFLPLLTTGLKAFAAFWSLVTLAVSAAFIAQSTEVFGSDFVNHTNLAAGNALLAASVLAFLYFIAVLVIQYIRPEHLFLATLVDTSFLGFLFIFFLGSAAALCTEADAFSFWSGWKFASLGSASIGLGFVAAFLVLGILLLEVIYTLRHYGRSYPTWRTPFNQLVAYGAPGSRVATASGTGASAGASTSVPMETVSGSAPVTNTVPTIQTQIAPAPMAAPPTTATQV